MRAHFLLIPGAQTRKLARTLLLCTLALAGPALAGAEARHPIQISYLGNAGWQISDGKAVILVDPNLSEFRKNAPAESMSGDDALAQPDPESIDAHIGKVDYILITHAHEDHMLDAPYIAKKTGATIIGAGSDRNQLYRYTARLMHALGNPAVVFPTHWDDYGIKPRADALKQVGTFVAEVRAASPKTRVIVPDYFTPVTLR